MAQHIKIRREQFFADVEAEYAEFLAKVRNLAAEHNLDADVAAEELDYLLTVKEVFEVSVQ